MRPLRIGIDARLPGGARTGGTETVVLGLAGGLAKLSDGDEEYFFLTRRGADQWIRPHLSGPCRVLEGPGLPWPAVQWIEIRIGQGWQGGGAAWEKVRSLPERVKVPLCCSEGTIERAGLDLMHFTFQDGFLTETPTVYQPHDLQHLHLPEYFDAAMVLYREVLYRTLCYQARMVAVASRWTRQDVMRRYGLAEEKVQVVPPAPMAAAGDAPSPGQLREVRERFGLPEEFLLYPAQTWPHKNHLGLLEALAILRDRRGLAAPLAATGYQNAFFARIAQRARELKLEGQVRFLGVVNAQELSCLYRLCRAVVIPTKFEAVSFPLWEAFLAGAPAACSRATSLPEQAGDAALLFDAEDPEQMAEAIERLWREEDLRRRLAERGRQRVAAFSWERTARLFRAHYRRLAGRRLEKADRELLEAPAPL